MLFKGNKQGEERYAMAGGGSCSFSWIEDYRSLRRFCVLESSEARAAFPGLLETALVGLSEFAPWQNVGVGHLRISESFSPFL